MSANTQPKDENVLTPVAKPPVTAEPPPEPALAKRWVMPSWGRTGLTMLGSLLIGLIVWQIASAQGWSGIVNFTNVPTPLEVFASLQSNLADPEFYIHLGVSVQRVMLSFLLAVAIGVPTGLIMARNQFARAFLLPYIEIFRPIPAVAWIPLAILMWPTEESSIIFITYLGAFFPIVLNTISGAEQTPEVLIRATRSLGAWGSHGSRFWQVKSSPANMASAISHGTPIQWCGPPTLSWGCCSSGFWAPCPPSVCVC